MTGAGPNPDELLGQARAGDGPALGRLLELYRNYLAVLARLQVGRRLQGKVDDSDLIQETFLEAHRHFAKFRGKGEAELACWLRQILSRWCKSRMARNSSTVSSADGTQLLHGQQRVP
jgi:RNA polymerase sigma-70 factor (ECF subfamily)